MKINLRIVDDIEALTSIDVKSFDEEFEDVEGFFRLCIGNCEVGSYYHEAPLQKDEVGGEYIDHWLNKLLDVIITLSNSKDYAAIKEIESINRWVEFRKIGTQIKISIVIDRYNALNDLYITEPYENFDHDNMQEEIVDFQMLKNSVIDAVQNFMDQIKEINPELLKSMMIINMEKKLKEIV